MNENIQMSLQLAGLGMGLVILSLLIIAAIIMLLGRVFRTRPGRQAEVETPPEAVFALPEAASSPAVTSQADEAAAIAVAIALQRRRSTSGGFRRKVDYSDVALIGEVVNVVNVDPETGAWANASRLKSIK